MLSGGSEFVQKDGTLFTVSLRTLAQGVIYRRTAPARLPGPSEHRKLRVGAGPCLAGRAGLPAL